MKKYKVAVYIGRFQPLHLGHMSIIRKGLEIADKVHILVGSANLPRTPKNPFSYIEREQMIRCSLHSLDISRVVISPLDDYAYNEGRWEQAVRLSVGSKEVVLVGCDKDTTTYYLSSFPEWDTCTVSAKVLESKVLSSIDIRKQIFEHTQVSGVSSSTLRFINQFKTTNNFKPLKAEYKSIQKYKDSWKCAPYPPVFVTTDARVFSGDSILLIKRRNNPGKHLWALPGGFVNENETILQACYRELEEETGLKLAIEPSSVKVYDSPARDTRGRTITHVYTFNINKNRYKLLAGDDAEEAQWIPLQKLQANNMYSDHFAIIGETK